MLSLIYNHLVMRFQYSDSIQNRPEWNACDQHQLMSLWCVHLKLIVVAQQKMMSCWILAFRTATNHIACEILKNNCNKPDIIDMFEIKENIINNIIISLKYTSYNCNNRKRTFSFKRLECCCSFYTYFKGSNFIICV